MKTTRFFAAALALLSVLSCQKEEQQTINKSENEGGAIITCTFAMNDAATKTTTTDGKTPLWAAGDKIMLYDGVSSTQELTLAASGTASSTTGVIDGADATKFTFVKPSGWENVYAIYPYSACVTGFSASAPKINFAGQDGSFAKANICAAAEISGTMSFKNVGAILKFTSKPAKVMNIHVPSAEMYNDYTVEFTGDTPNLTSVSASHVSEVDLSDGTGAVYIGVPAGTIAANSVFKYRSPSRGVFGTYTTSGANTLERNKIYNLGDITLSGEPDLSFTVSVGADGTAGTLDDVKVFFSKGNLYYNGNTWNFENNQYDYRTYAGKNSCIAGTKSNSGTPANHWGTFGWSTSATTYGMSTSIANADYSGGFRDWGENAISNGGNTANLWSTLSGNEGNWRYLLDTRSASTVNGIANARYCKVTVSDVPGMIIFPDSYIHPSDVSLPAAASINFAEGLFATVSYTAEQWQKMESAGCVFLPAAGYRMGTDMKEVATYGYYWSATLWDADNAYGPYFYKNWVYPNGGDWRLYGYSVRLVCAAQ